MSEYERLPNIIVPLFYDISLNVDLSKKKFNGVCTIEIDIKGKTNSFQLNAYNLIIKAAVLNYEDTIASISNFNDLQKVELTFPSFLPLSKNIIKISYEGQLNTSMKGFYFSSYKCSDDSIENIAVTHFEPTNARYAFPCWDEPAYRTPFKISICTEKGYSAISNMPIVNHSLTETHETFDFDVTPPMSTYLVAFAVGKFDQKKLKGTEISVYCRKDTADELATFALDVANKALDFYNKWFGIEYNLPKLDMLAVPDFQGGAMENWGLITFRERALLVSDENTSISIKQNVALIISHEIAHMWFGNFVTMEWWTDLWLKEGFATWIEYLCVDHCFPSYDIWTQFVVNEYFRTLKLDSLLNTHPIEVVVKSPEEISEIFDTISYAKGASVIRMLYEYLGEEDFQKGLRNYLSTYKFKCTKTEDLWNSLQDCTSKSVTEVMNSWTQQPGYPFILVSMTFSETDNTIESIKLTQERFIQSGEKSSDDLLWRIPITIADAEHPQNEVLKFVMKEKEHVINLKTMESKYISLFLNPNANGIYRVKYADKQILDSLKRCLSLPTWRAADKFSFLEDCFALANSAQFLYTDVLEMLGFLKTEHSFVLWQMIDSNLSDIHYLLGESGYGVTLINRFILEMALPSYQRLGWNESITDSHNDILLRPLIITLLSKAKHPEVITEAQRRYINLIDNEGIIPANIRKVVYSIVSENSTDKEFKQLTDRFLLDSVSNDEKGAIISSLGKMPMQFHDQFTDWLMGDLVRNQDKLMGLVSASGASSMHRDSIWKLMQLRWTDLRQMFSGQFLMGTLLNECLGRFSSVTKVDEIEAFFATNDSTSPRNVKLAIEKIKNNDKRLRLHVDKVHNYLVTKYGPV